MELVLLKLDSLPIIIAKRNAISIFSSNVTVKNIANCDSEKIKRFLEALPILVQQLLEAGLAEPINEGIEITYQDFSQLEENGFENFSSFWPWSPFHLELKTLNYLGHPQFNYVLTFFYGNQPVHLERVGCFLKRDDNIYRLDPQTFALVNTIEQHRSAQNNENTIQTLIDFSKIKGIALEVGVQLNDYILKETVLVPPKIRLDIASDQSGSVSFFPQIQELQTDGFKQAFLTDSTVQDVYSVHNASGSRVRIVLNENQKEVLKRMQKVRHLRGHDAVKLINDPLAIFEGVVDEVDLDRTIYGKRVRGIGKFPIATQPFIKVDTGIFDDKDKQPQDKKNKIQYGLEGRGADGEILQLDVSFDELFQLNKDVEQAVKSGKDTFQFRDSLLLIDENFLKALKKTVEIKNKKDIDSISKHNSDGQYLLIYTNDSDVDYSENSEDSNQSFSNLPELPKALSVELKDHQKQGLAWLQKNYLLNRRGCLLADDMGLGKTLQILTFLAWLIEKKEISLNPNPDISPWRPVLIVAPLILIENETWVADMKKFFVGNGAIFEPYLSLTSKNIKKFRKETGQETKIGAPVLDTEKLKEFRVILTNYDTITNYQHSFSVMKSDLSVVVTDEAQEYKDQNTKVSHALKSLSPRFKIASTGTPVETRLLNVWNLFDFLQPGFLLGSASDFSKEYENQSRSTIESKVNTEGQLNKLKAKLKFGRTDAFLLRRDKRTEKIDLPAKHHKKITCQLSSQQRQMHLDYVAAVKNKNGMNPLAALQRIMWLYAHPHLVEKDVPSTPEHCPKLSAMLKELANIKRAREKVLIFSRSITMQQILKTCIDAQFGLNVGVVNGETPRVGATKTASLSRKKIIDDFRCQEGFNAIILSLEIASTGLTLVEANHVIHYERWWNPAKELQATDRTYRIGQKKDVYVYHFVAKDPSNEFISFDERLDDLIERRIKLAQDFLSPVPTEENFKDELSKNLFNQNHPSQQQPKYITSDDISKLDWSSFEALVAVLESKAGYTVYLTPKIGDGGIDVISVCNKEIRLIQCKHTTSSSSHFKHGADVVKELVSAVDLYRAKYLSKLLSTYEVHAYLVSNKNFDRHATREADMKDIKLRDPDWLYDVLKVEEYKTTNIDLQAMEDKRLKSNLQIKEKLNSLR